MGILRCLLFLVLVLRSSQVLHNKMFKAVLRAPVLFFDTNPIGKCDMHCSYYVIRINVCPFCIKG